jgi:hypothetical protein
MELALVMTGSGIGSGIIPGILFGVAEAICFGVKHAVQGILDSVSDHFPEVVTYCAFIELDYLRLFSRMFVHGSDLLLD